MENLKDKIIEDLIKYTKSNSWNNFYAKWTINHNNDQSLLVHSINQASLMKYFLDNIIESGIISEEEQIILIVSSFLSDTGKELPRFQEAAIFGINEPEAYNHINREAIEQLNKRLDFFKSKFQNEYHIYRGEKEWEEFKNKVKAHVCYHQRVKAPDLKDSCARFGGTPPFGPLIDFIDDLCSVKIIDDAYRIALRKDGVKHLIGNVNFVFHKISKIRGILTVFLNEALISIHKKFGYEPLLFYPDGILYIAKTHEKIESDLNDLIELIKNKINNLLKDPTIQMNLSNIIFGPITQTIVLYPNLLTEHAIRSKIQNELKKSIKNLEKNRKKNEDNFRKKKITKKESSELVGETYLDFFSLKAKEYNITQELLIEKYTQYQGVMTYVFAIMNVFLEWVKDKQEAYNAIIEKLENYFPYIDLESIKNGYANTASKINKLNMLIKLWKLNEENLLITDNKYLRDFEDRIINFLNDIYHIAEPYKEQLITNEMLYDLLFDIEYTEIGTFKENYIKIINELQNAYFEGKSNKENRACFICGLKYYQDAIKERIGEGPRKFANKLIGGKAIGSGHQAGICKLCECESTLRKILMGNLIQELILITPELNMSWELRRVWSNQIDEFLKTRWKGISILNEKNIQQIVKSLAIQGNELIKKIDAHWIASNIIVSKKKKNDIIETLKKIFQNDITKFNESFNTEFQNFETIVDEIYNNNWWHEDLANIIEPATQIQFFYETPNYIIILLR
ncbi:MAG: hypothetical protein ACTSVV_15490, partial [Promethearchaeota archaeon]